jgi:hypothetical protein
MAGRTAVKEHGRRRAQQADPPPEEGQDDPPPNDRQGDDPPARQDEPQDPGAVRERSVLRGGPGEDAPPEFNFSYDGKSFSSQEELTNYINGLRQPAPREEPRPQARQPDQQPQQPQTPAEKKNWLDETNWETELFRDPKGTIAKIRQGVTAEISQQLTEQYRQEENMKTWWTDFYKENKDLVGKEFLVTTVLQRDFNQIADLKVGEARPELAKRVRGELEKLGVPKPNREDRSGDRTLVEAGTGGPRTGRRPASSTQEEPTRGSSLSSIIRSRQAARSRPTNGSTGRA